MCTWLMKYFDYQKATKIENYWSLPVNFTLLIVLGSSVIMQSFSVLFVSLVILFTVLLYYHYRHNFSRHLQGDK
jgi:succinate-acetate transporter protein